MSAAGKQPSRATAEQIAETVAQQRAERIRRAQNTGWAGFLAKLHAGQEVTKLDIVRGMLGHGRTLEGAEQRVEEGLGAASEHARLLQKQILTVYARQEVLHKHLSDRAKWEALPWLKRRKAARPSVPDLPPLMDERELADAREDVAEVPKPVESEEAPKPVEPDDAGAEDVAASKDDLGEGTLDSVPPPEDPPKEAVA